LENRKGLEKLKVQVIDMTCAACSNSVEKALLNLAGVCTASVTLLQNKADVTYDSFKVKVSAYSLWFSCFGSVFLSVFARAKGILYESAVS
jgi:copper chaperone CopZ